MILLLYTAYKPLLQMGYTNLKIFVDYRQFGTLAAEINRRKLKIATVFTAKDVDYGGFLSTQIEIS